MFKKMLSTILKTAVPSLLKMGFDRMQQGSGAGQPAGPAGNVAGLSALHAGILQKIHGLMTANAALETKLGLLAVAIVLFWGVVVGPADSADHRAWVVIGSVMLVLALLTVLAAMWTHPHRGLVVDFGDEKYASYPAMDDQALLRRLIATAEASVRALHKINAFKAACYKYGVLLFAAGAAAITMGLLTDGAGF